MRGSGDAASWFFLRGKATMAQVDDLLAILGDEGKRFEQAVATRLGGGVDAAAVAESDAAAYERYYGAKHPSPDLLGTFVYGLPELTRDALRTARRIASPGCFAT